MFKLKPCYLKLPCTYVAGARPETLKIKIQLFLYRLNRRIDYFFYLYILRYYNMQKMDAMPSFCHLFREKEILNFSFEKILSKIFFLKEFVEK